MNKYFTLLKKKTNASWLFAVVFAVALSSMAQNGVEKTAVSKACEDLRLIHQDDLDYNAAKKRPAILLFHGLTNCPWEFKDVGEELYKKGFNVVIPRLPGHGTKPKDLLDVTAIKWREFAEKQALKLHESSEHVFVGGSSLGALLAMRTVQRLDFLEGAILLAPPIANQLLPPTVLDLVCAPENTSVEQTMFRTDGKGKSILALTEDGIKTTDKGEPSNPQKIFYYTAAPAKAFCEVHRLVTAISDQMPNYQKRTFLITSSGDTVVKETPAQELLCKSDSFVRGINYDVDAKVGHLIAPRFANKNGFQTLIQGMTDFLNGEASAGEDICKSFRVDLTDRVEALSTTPASLQGAAGDSSGGEAPLTSSAVEPQ